MDYLNYSNTDAVGNALTYASPIKLNALAKSNNCLTLVSATSDKVIFPSQAYIADGNKVSFSFIANTLSSSTYACLLQNFIGDVIVIGIKTTEIHVRANQTEGRSFAITFTPGVLYNVVYSKTTPNSIIVNGVTYTTTVDTYDALTYPNMLIGARNSDQAGYGLYFNGRIFNIKVYNTNDELIHWYPLAEGAGTTVYDVVGDLNGTLTVGSTTTSWATKQDVFAYNLTHGFTLVDSVKVPYKYDAVTPIGIGTTHPRIEYGHNMCESVLDFSQGVSNVAEIKQVTSTDLTAYTPSEVYTSGSALAPFYKHNNNVDGVKIGESNYLTYTKKLEDVNAIRVKSKLRNPNSGLFLNSTTSTPTVSTAPTIPNFNLATFTLPLSFGYWVKFDNAIPSIVFGKYGMGSLLNTGFGMNTAFTAQYVIYAALRAVSGGANYDAVVAIPTNFYTDEKWHSIVTTIGASGGRVKLYFDGVLKNQGAVHDLTSVPFSGLFSLQSKDNSFAKPFVCNFDMSDGAAPYTIADYQNGKDVPSSLLNTITGNRFLLLLNNRINGTTNTWIDESVGNNNMTLAGTYIAKDI